MHFRSILLKPSKNICAHTAHSAQTQSKLEKCSFMLMLACHNKSVTAKYKTQHNNLLYWRMVLSQGRVSLEQRLGTALQTAILLILSLFLCCFSYPTYLTHWRILYHTHYSRLPRLSSPGLGSLLNHLVEHCVVYWANWLPQYQNQKMLSSINWLLQLIERD